MKEQTLCAVISFNYQGQRSRSQCGHFCSSLFADPSHMELFL